MNTESKQREAFEAWAHATSSCVPDLKSATAVWAWTAWQAALAQKEAQPVEPVAFPLESSAEAATAIAAVMAEYNYPANPANAARVGWRAARLYTAPVTHIGKGESK